MKFLRAIVIALAIGAVLIFVAGKLFPLPSLENRVASEGISISANSRIGSAVLREMDSHAGRSGIVPLPGGEDAFAMRISLARTAQISLDVQYYIWQNDLTGILLLDALRMAAERGVRVRLLVDDNGTPDLDQELIALNESPNFEVRFFNPFVLRNPRLLSYGFDFPRLNRRMHNKSFTADGAVTIVGGRNVGDIYFNSNEDVNYFDFDIMAIGPAARDVSQDFDGYWNSQSAYPAELLIDTSTDGLALLAQRVETQSTTPRADEYRIAIQKSDLINNMMSGQAEIEWATMALVSDDPVKGLGPVDESQLMISRLRPILGEINSSFDLVSAYFIPGEQFTSLLTGLAENNVRIRTVTNSQEATDVVSVHSGYVKFRGDLLDAGVEVFELKSNQDDLAPKDKLGILGSSTSSLHAKTFSIDRNRIFIGSFNFDPRSALLNTEMGFLVDSPTLASAMADALDTIIADSSYRVMKTATGQVAWEESMRDGTIKLHTSEPKTSYLSRLYVRFLGVLPIMWLL